MSSPETAPFERLAKMIERELELAGRGRMRELDEAVRRRGEYLRTLPVPAPPAARGSIARAKALHSRLIIETLRVRESLDQSRAALRTHRRISQTYTPRPRPRWFTSA